MPGESRKFGGMLKCCSNFVLGGGFLEMGRCGMRNPPWMRNFEEREREKEEREVKSREEETVYLKFL